MKKIIKCMDDTLSELADAMMKIVSDESIPLAEKNKLMAPIADQKKVILYAKEALDKISKKEYKAECGMQNVQSLNDLKGKE